MDDNVKKNEGQEQENLSDRVKIMSPGKLVLKRFFRSKLSMIGLVMLILLFVFSFIGPLFSPYGETQKAGATKWVTSKIPHDMVTTDKDENGNNIVYHYIEISDPYIVNSKTYPTWKNLLGTDQYGYDILTRLMYGGRVSLSLGFIVIFAEMLLGTVIGSISGYFGGWVDQVIMRIVDVFNCLPGLPILLLAASLLDGWGVPPNQKIYWLMLILTVFGWSGIARLVRGQILSLREQEFMIAAESTGISVRHKIFKHLVPNVMPQLIVQATLGLGGIILYEATLSYLGLGIPFPYAAWGTMINATSGAGGRDILQNYPNLWIPAGVLIVMAVLSFNFIGDGLRDAFDPKARR
ncbi:MAG: ABC transporter permease [Clostridia bacterium]|nr:ABC transporter permease [Clostridia bacterium]